jgi:hypothetical protein
MRSHRTCFIAWTIACLIVFTLSGCRAATGPVSVDSGNPFIDILGVIVILAAAIALIGRFTVRR